jgi:hypothetical protein
LLSLRTQRRNLDAATNRKLVMSPEQLSLLEPTFTLPEGFAYRGDFVSADEAAEVVPRLAELELKEFEFHGYLGKRRVASFGLRYSITFRSTA